MAAKYRKVDPRMWTDEKFCRLTTQEKLLAIWLLTSSRVNRCGIVMWSPGLASEETGIEPTVIDTVLDTVCSTMNWVRDTVSRTLFLARWWRYNRPDNASALKGALSDLHDLPRHCLGSSLRQAAQDLPENMRDEYLAALDTVCDTVAHTVTYTVSPQEQEQEQEVQHVSPGGDECVPPASNGNGHANPEAPALLLRLIERWNELPDVQRCRDATPKRITAFRQRSRNDGWVNGVKPALERIARSSFCRGRNQQGWIADIDWFLRPDTVTRILEGKYDDRSQPTRVQDIPTGGIPIFNPETGEIVNKKE